ncbi:MAG: hypothetical protein IMZ65_01955, partial [Planctomycetes bacterium]|nr:hypothetical protein [Planctomycetota bacterium]
MNAIPRHTAGRPGIAMLVTLIFLALFACLAVAIASSANMNMVVTHNRLQSQQAGALAETGLQLMQRHLGGLHLTTSDDAADLHHAIAEHLAASFVGSSMIDVTQIDWDSARVTLPGAVVRRPDGLAGTLDLCIAASGGANDNTTITIESTGRFGAAARQVRYNMTVQRGRSVLMDYGIASKSPISLSGTASVTGANNPAEGSIMSATYSTSQAVRMVGDAAISGGVTIVNPTGEVVQRGGAVIQGETQVGVAEPEWPEVDPSVFMPYVTNIYAGSGAGDLALSNVRIPPNTNPTFSGNVVVRGVMYVESPNKVQFTGNATIIGVIVCEEPAVDDLKKNLIHFSGNVSTAGVESLDPDDAAYDGLRELTGSFLLAPGFSA